MTLNLMWKEREDEITDCTQQSEVISEISDNELYADTAASNSSWIKSNLSLNFDSKTVIESGQMLDDRITEAAQTILNNQFPGINC